MAEVEMPGLMAVREEFGADKPLKGARITGSLHMTIQTAVLIETLVDLGAEVRWASCNIFSTQDHAAAAIAARGIPVFAFKGESLEQYWEFCRPHLRLAGRRAANMILDDGGDATLFILLGANAETDPALISNPKSEEEEACSPSSAAASRRRPAGSPRSTPPSRASRRRRRPASTASTSCRRRASFRFPAINVNDSVTKSKFDNKYGCRESLVDAIRRGTDVMMAGKVALVCGYGDVGKGSAQSLRGAGARVIVTEIDPICALQAAMDGFEVTTLEDMRRQGRYFCHSDRQQGRHHRRSHARHEGHGDRLQHRPFRQRDPGRLPAQFPLDQRQAAGRHHRVSIAPPHRAPVGRPPRQSRQRHRPSELRDVGVLHQPDPGADRALEACTGKYKNEVYVLPKHLDEKVARLHLGKLGVRLTELKPEQAAYIGVAPTGPFKSEHYRY